MPQDTEKLAVLFADICGSTALYDKLGDETARRLIARCIATMTGGIAAFQGRLIKTIGDEIMCVFPSAEAAFNAACAMQHAVEHGKPEDGHQMHIRVGFHYGDVIRESGDVFGDTVNVAARVAATSRASQIMTTKAVVDALPTALQERTRQIMRAEFKGKQEEFDIFIVIWELDDMLSTRIGTPIFRKSPDNIDELTLSYRDLTLKVNKERRSAIMGRGDACDFIVQNGFSSRQHARIELRFGKFFIVDQSTNGTYVRFHEGSVVRIAREELILQGSGSISMGQSYAENPADLVEFSITAHHAQS
ncbi:MAG: adenylate/guanylate cyclase domain-containing protein [Gallionella sp.]|nr:adenylate/guanylate cyclase domain-containing protein [Gallionella sp.]